MKKINADETIADVRARLQSVDRLREWCDAQGLSYWGVYNFLRRPNVSPTIHWLESVDQALRAPK